MLTSSAVIFTVEGNQPGPSTGFIRRPRETAFDIADLYGRLQEVQDTNRNWEDATAKAMQEVRRDISRIESNADTQKKYFGQQLELVNQQAKSAEQKAEMANQQVDSVRLRTEEMHKSLSAMHTHTTELTSGLSTVMNRFSQLHFDLPNAFDDWMRVRMGKEGAGPSTVSGMELHASRWSSTNEPMHVPQAPSMPTPAAQTYPPSAEETSSTPPPPNPSQTQSDTSPSKYFDFLQGNALVDLESELGKNGGRSRSGGTRSSGSRGSQPSPVVRSAPLVSDTTDRYYETMEMQVDIVGGSIIDEGPGARENDKAVVEDEDKAAEEAAEVTESADLVEVSSRPTTQEAEDMDMETEEEGGGNTEIEEGEIRPTLSPSVDALPATTETLSVAEVGSPPQPPQTFIFPPTPSPFRMQMFSSPAIIGDQIVHPPEGMLAETTPPSSQPPLPSNHRLLALPVTRTADIQLGLVTRSRSRSRSTSGPPPENIRRRR